MPKNTIKIKMLEDVAGLSKGDERTVDTRLALRLIANKTAEAATKEGKDLVKSYADKKKQAKEAASKAAEEANEKRKAAAEEAKIKEAIDAVISSGDRDALNSYTKSQLLPFALSLKGITEESKKAEIVEALISDDNCTSC